MASLGELERAVMDLLWAGQEAATANTLRDLLAQSTQPQDGSAISKAIVPLAIATQWAR